MGIAAIRDGIKTRLETIPGLRCHDTVPDSVMPPAVVVRPSPEQFATYDVALGGVRNLLFEVTLVVSKAWDRTAQDTLDSYIDPTGANSVYAAMEAGPTLGGIVADAYVRSASNYGMITWGTTAYLGCDFLVEVMV